LTGIPADYLHVITDWAFNLATVNNLVLTALAGYSAAKPGPMVNATVSPAAKGAIMFITMLGASAFMRLALVLLIAGYALSVFPTSASAATVKAASTTATDPISAALSQIQNVNANIIANAIAAIEEADADAGTVITPATATTAATVKDPISHACYPAQIQYLK